MTKWMAVLLILAALLSFVPMQASAADYINVASVASSYGIASGSTAYTALSMINNTYASQLTTAQKQGIVVFMFEGAGNDLSASRRMGAMCVVVKNGSVAYLNRNCSTIPDYPFNPAKNSGTAMPTVKSGIYSFSTVNHNGKYAALNVTNAQVVRHSSQTSYYSGSSTAINVHRRDSNSIAAASASWVNSAGCFLIGQAGTGSTGEYARFIQAVGIVGSGAAGNATYTSAKSGKIVVDRSLAGSYLTNVGYSSGALSLLGAVDESQPPTKAAISTDKTAYAANETVTFNMSGNGTTNTLWVYRVDGQWQNYYQNAGSSYQLAFGWEGRYKALVETWNSKGSKVSNEVYFQVGKPTYATIKANKSSYTTDETATFTLTSDGDTNTVWFYYADGTSEYIQNCTTTCTKKFTKTGKVEALVEAWNGVGSFISDKISFTVTAGSGTNTPTTQKPATSTTTKPVSGDQPTSATISVNKSTVKVEENITLTFSGNGATNTLWVYFPNGTSRYYQNAGTSRIMAFANPGKYEALVETWNAAGTKSFISQKISFTVVPADAPTSAKITANKSGYTTGENVTFSFNCDGKINDLWVYYPDGSSKSYQNVGTSKTLSYTTPGKYEALVQTWNEAATANVISARISFTVSAPTTTQPTTVKPTTTKPTTAPTTAKPTTTKPTTAPTTIPTTVPTKVPTTVPTTGKPGTASTPKPTTINPTLTTVVYDCAVFGHEYVNGWCRICREKDPNHVPSSVITQSPTQKPATEPTVAPTIPTPADSDNEGGSNLIFIILAILLIALLGVMIVFLVKKKKK